MLAKHSHLRKQYYLHLYNSHLCYVRIHSGKVTKVSDYSHSQDWKLQQA